MDCGRWRRAASLTRHSPHWASIDRRSVPTLHEETRSQECKPHNDNKAEEYRQLTRFYGARALELPWRHDLRHPRERRVKVNH
jgi:hypothetical protein